jgi:hypothetical protein
VEESVPPIEAELNWPVTPVGPLTFKATLPVKPLKAEVETV